MGSLLRCILTLRYTTSISIPLTANSTNISRGTGRSTRIWRIPNGKRKRGHICKLVYRSIAPPSHPSGPPARMTPPTSSRNLFAKSSSRGVGSWKSWRPRCLPSWSAFGRRPEQPLLS
ncbi:hypothetical protein C8J57DRAFT_166957 [Mycena rebaudengoi]|nr:hypothetical protein C8J57DRAFT_166957 [Mycena rebaudengoi]